MSAVFLLAARAEASEDLGFRTVTDIGCDLAATECWITLTGEPFGANDGCSVVGIEVRWDNASTEGGKRAFAAFYGAFLAGKKVQIVLLGCTASGRPKPWWYHIR